MMFDSDMFLLSFDKEWSKTPGLIPVPEQILHAFVHVKPPKIEHWLFDGTCEPMHAHQG